MVMRFSIRGRIFPKGGGDDAEHPVVIPMDSPTSPQVPRGPMTRARARAIENEVTSLLSQFPFDAHEDWMLPQTETLCILRYQEDPLGEARNNGQVGKYTDEEAREEEVLLDISNRTSGLRPGHPAPGAYNTIDYSNSPKSTYRPRTSGFRPDIRPSPRKSGPIDRTVQKFDQFRPDIRPPGPDIRHPDETPDIRPGARTSGPTPRVIRPSGPCTHPFSP
jgi:hypothetical protein